VREQLRLELVSLFGRELVSQVKQEHPMIDLEMATAVHVAADELLAITGLPERQRERVASYPQELRLCLCAWIAGEYTKPPDTDSIQNRSVL